MSSKTDYVTAIEECGCWGAELAGTTWVSRLAADARSAAVAASTAAEDVMAAATAAIMAQRSERRSAWLDVAECAEEAAAAAEYANICWEAVKICSCADRSRRRMADDGSQP